MSEDRQQEILRIVGEKRIAKIPELSALCHVSEATIRRDLNKLDRQGLIRRTHGGAVLFAKGSQEQPHLHKLELMIAEKKRIAATAASMVSDGESIYIDPSSTSFPMVHYLSEVKYLTVITNSIDIIKTIVLHPTSQMVVVGGILRTGFNVLFGSFAESFLRNLKVDKVFIGTDAVDIDSGIYSSSFIEVSLKQVSIQSGRTRFLLVDSSKFNNAGLIKICDLDDFHYIITDSGLAQDKVAKLQETNAQILLV